MSTVSAVIDVVGVPAEGLEALPAVQRERIASARTLVGSPRLLNLVPVREGQARHTWPAPMLPGLNAFLSEVGTDFVVLATGDPLVSGVGSTLIRVLGSEAVRVHPAVSSVALARARMGWPSESTDVVSLVSRSAYAVRRHLAPGARVVALSAGSATPFEVARVLVELGLGETSMAVLGNLGAANESRFDCAAGEFAAVDPSDLPLLNVVALEVPTTALLWGVSPGLPDEAFAHDGQITKREVRALALAVLRPMPGQRLWDLGAGSGSVSVEWCLAAPRTSAVAVERDPARAERVGENAATFGVPIKVHTSDSLDLISEMPSPDAVFIGGGATEALIDAAWAALALGGRLVVHCVTLDTEALVVAAQARLGGDLRRVTIERAEALGRHLSWKPARPIVQWSATKRHDNEGRP